MKCFDILFNVYVCIVYVGEKCENIIKYKYIYICNKIEERYMYFIDIL